MLADAQVVLGAALERDPAGAEESVRRHRRAIALDPGNATAHQSFGFTLLGRGQTDEAIQELIRSTQLDPLAKSAGTALSLAYAFGRHASEAMAAARRIQALDSAFALVPAVIGMAHLVAGHPDSAIRAIDTGSGRVMSIPGYAAKLAFAYAVAGRWSDVERLRGELQPHSNDNNGGVEAAYADFLLGNPEPLVRALGSAAGARYWRSNYLFGCNPLLDPVWADPRFAGVMKRWGQRPCPLAQKWPGVPRSKRG
jgi:predicted Zn-dependent protease